jgi:peptidoglycan/LPS O-acetylase OafA/YrhL
MTNTPTHESPPTSPGPLPQPPSLRLNLVYLGMMIHAAFVAGACLVTPLAMNSNIWPIAAVFWSVLTVPPALAIGALAGLLLRRWPRRPAIVTLLVLGAAMALIVAFIMANNR